MIDSLGLHILGWVYCCSYEKSESGARIRRELAFIVCSGQAHFLSVSCAPWNYPGVRSKPKGTAVVLPLLFSVTLVCSFCLFLVTRELVSTPISMTMSGRILFEVADGDTM